MFWTLWIIAIRGSHIYSPCCVFLLSFYHTLKTRYRQRFRRVRRKVGGPENLVRGPGNFIVPPPFNFYFNPWLLARCVIMYLEIGSETRTITRPTVIKYNKTQNNVAIKSGNAVVMTYRVTFHCCKSSWLADRADYEPLVHHWKIRVHCCRYLQRNCARLRFSYFLRCGKL